MGSLEPLRLIPDWQSVLAIYSACLSFRILLTPERPPQRFTVPLIVLLSILGSFLLPDWATLGNRHLCWIFLIAAFPLVWKWATEDLDTIHTNAPRAIHRLGLVIGFLWIPVSPLGLVFFSLYTLRFWKPSHHQRACHQILWMGSLLWMSWTVILGTHFILHQNVTVNPASFFLISFICLGSRYVWPAIMKLRLRPRFSWAWKNPTHLLGVNARSEGWLGFLSLERVVRFFQRLSILNIPINLITLSIELLPLLFFVSPKVIYVFLGLQVLLHLGIFLVSGILFWESIWVGTGFLILLWQIPQLTEIQSYSLLLLAPLLILGQRIWSIPALAWWDTPLSQCLRLFGYSKNGKRYLIPHSFFEPFETQFYKLSPEMFGVKTLTEAPGHTLPGHDTIEDLKRIEATQGNRIELEKLCPYQPEVQDISPLATSLIRQVFQRDPLTKRFLPPFLSFLKAPWGYWYLWEYGTPRYRYQEPIESIEMVYRETYLTKEGTLTRTREFLVYQAQRK